MLYGDGSGIVRASTSSRFSDWFPNSIAAIMPEKFTPLTSAVARIKFLNNLSEFES